MLGNCFFIQGGEYTEEPLWEGEKGVDLGLVINALISLIITGAILFFIFVRPMNRLQKKEAAAPTVEPAPSAEVTLLTEIRDLLAKRYTVSQQSVRKRPSLRVPGSRRDEGAMNIRDRRTTRRSARLARNSTPREATGYQTQANPFSARPFGKQSTSRAAARYPSP